MTNAIEATKRYVDGAFNEMKGRMKINYSIKDMLRGADELEHALDEHLEELRNESDRLSIALQEMRQERDDIQGRLHAVDASYAKLDGQNAELQNMNAILSDAYQQQKNLTSIATREVNDLDDEVVDLKGQLARMTEDRDAHRNRCQVLEMANQTSGEVIRGLRNDLEEAEQSNITEPESELTVAPHADAYTLGFKSQGGPCPFAINTVERLHWMDGAREGRPYVIVPNNNAPSSWWPFS